MTLKITLNKNNFKSNIKAKVAIIVPYRDQIKENRKIQLKIFIKHIKNFMNNYDKWKIFIIKQNFDNLKFNRGKLLNIGFKEASKKGYNTFIFHDVDLLPEDSMFKLYTTYPNLPIHLGSLWKNKYDYETFVGGVISINKTHFEKINGFPNIFWGWGGEDDAFYFRLMINKIKILKPLVEDWGKINEMEHGFNPNEGNEKKKENRNFDKINWKKNGLNNLTYTKYKNVKYKRVTKIYINFDNFINNNYNVNDTNIAQTKQELKNYVYYPRLSYKNLDASYQKFKKTLQFIIKYYKQGTFIYIEKNKIKIFSSFNFDPDNYIDLNLINKKKEFISKNLENNNLKIDNLEFFLNTQPFSLTNEVEYEFIPIISDIIENKTNDILIKELFN